MVVFANDVFPRKIPLIITTSDVLLPGVTVKIPITESRNVNMVRSQLLGSNSSPNPIIGIVPKQAEDSSEAVTIDKDTVGVIGQVFHISRTSWPKPTFMVLVSGLCRFRVDKLIMEEPYLVAIATQLDGFGDESEISKTDPTAQEFRDVAAKLFAKLTTSYSHITDKMSHILDLMPLSRLADFCCSYSSATYAEKLDVLNTVDVAERLKKVIPIMQRFIQELDKSGLNDRRLMPFKTSNSKLTRMKPLEMGTFSEEGDDLSDLIKRAKDLSVPAHVSKVLNRELQRLKRMGSFHPEHSIIRTYVELLMDLPWNVSAIETLDIHKARKDLDDDHFAMTSVKRRILEFLAVRQLNKSKKGPILCLVGPPGVGKTSIAKSIAKTTGRPFHCISLGGTYNQSDIRGHRKTYLGAMPGRIIQALKTTGVNNPVLLLDEVDKVGSGAHGSVAAALLEVLDSAQNSHFTDHYVNLHFDLSQVMFLATANNANVIPAPLLDRMEIIKLNGYTEEEKLQIAQKHLLPKQLREHGLENSGLQVPESCIIEIIRNYTQEAGVRSLERHLGALCRHRVVKLVENQSDNSAQNTLAPVTLDETCLIDILGPPPFGDFELWRRAGIPGVALGLSWTEYGGRVLIIETTRLNRSSQGSLVLTGHLGDVMKESASLAVDWLRSVAKQYGLNSSDPLSDADLHIHFPAGAISKDGPSAGIAIATALYSLFTNRPIANGVVMTGEITLSGAVLPVGGVKEKVLAAHRACLKKVILPQKNYSDLADIPESTKNDLEFSLVTEMSEVLQAAFDGMTESDSSVMLNNMKSNDSPLLCKL
ncbi:lon protease homolog 2, peroxisomal isoform X2 [Bemisia tabaci]|uniref:lon protease homolog 2, peroxisomal isoform X2 n=1 Tax=Bemisia tabaci TaxID=7038 RepID=UPI0008F9D4D4|nr:PREDICTED: lon protease homolog 2, peroxisomal-like isoform X2 [Bemisia tabaci]